VIVTPATNQQPAGTRVRGSDPVAHSGAMREVLAAAEDVAMGNTTVLLLGESGTGKEIVARHIHRTSPRAAGPWVAVNCAALPSELLESELFGHERGAFTGAIERRVGRIEQAERGTLLLDEISELPPALQAKLLRVLQEREIDRVGGGRPVPVDVRIIATSNRDLAEMVRRNLFRTDLYYRLNVFPIVLPPLRDRPDDIPPLTDHLLHKLAEALGRPAPVISEEALCALVGYRFPGNVRELGNIIERALVRCREPILQLQELSLAGFGQTSVFGSSPAAAPRGAQPVAATTASGRRFLPEGVPIDLASLERLAIQEALRREGGNRTHAARLLGISLRTLRNKLREYRARSGVGHSPTGPHQATLAGDGQILPGGSADDAGEPGLSPAAPDEAGLARPSHSGDAERAA
jgi:transcriptional regulator with GAF, ATPase, and Fis domain